MGLGHIYSFTLWLWLVLSSSAELSSCDRDGMVTNPKYIFILPFTESLSIPDPLIKSNMEKKGKEAIYTNIYVDKEI